jgi:hypothetical protein
MKRVARKVAPHIERFSLTANVEPHAERAGNSVKAIRMKDNPEKLTITLFHFFAN